MKLAAYLSIAFGIFLAIFVTECGLGWNYGWIFLSIFSSTFHSGTGWPDGSLAFTIPIGSEICSFG